jgi:hypothetical protein
VLPNSNQHQIDGLRSPLILLPELEVVRWYIPRDVYAWCSVFTRVKQLG